MRMLSTASVLVLLPLQAEARPRTFPDGVVDIGVLIDGPWDGNDAAAALVVGEIAGLTEGEFTVRFPDDKRLTGSWSRQSVASALQTLLADPDVDLILAMGTIASHLAVTHGALPKPVFAPFVLDPLVQEGDSAGPGSGIDNLAYLTLPATFETELNLFRDIVPFDHIAVLTSGPLTATLPEDFPAIFESLTDAELTVEVVPVGFEAAPVLDALPAEVDAVYTLPLLQLPPAEFDRLVAGLIARTLPSWSAFGRSDVERGILAGTGRDTLLPSIARKLALHVQGYLLGDEMSALPVTFSSRAQLAINLDTADAMGLSLRWDVLAEAVRIHARPDVSERLSLAEAVFRASATNLDVAAGAYGVAAGEHEVNEALARLLPGIEVSALASTIDEDRAAASLGTAAQHAASASVRATQPLFVEPAIAGFGAARDLQQSRSHQQAGRRADVILEVVTTYVNVLRARTFEELQQDNLRVTRQNLDLARVRRRIGVAGPAETYRWEVQVALARKDSLQAFYERKRAEVALNRVLHRPLDAPVHLMEFGITDSGLIANEERLRDYIDDPLAFATFADFLVERGLESAPELLALSEVISAQERLHRSARRATFAPVVAAEAKLTQRVLEEGAGSDGGLDLSALGVPPQPERDDTDWQLGVSASLPVFSGGARRAAIRRNASEVQQRITEREALAERLELRIRAGLYSALSALYSTGHARDAAEAADATLDIATESYTVGGLSFLELLDAQQAALQADLGLVDALYAFQLVLIEVMRASNDFGFLYTQAEEEQWFAALDAFFEARQVVP